MTFTISYPQTKSAQKQFNRRFGLNALYAGKHWARRCEDAEYIHNTVHACLMEQRIPRRMYNEPVSITFYWDDHLDCSNHAYLGKMIEDALKGWLIEDDSRRYVKSITHKFCDSGHITVEVIPYVP